MKGHASANRTLTGLKAALNLAVKNRLLSPATAQEWSEVTPLEGRFASLAMIEKHYGHLVHDTARERLARVQMA